MTDNAPFLAKRLRRLDPEVRRSILARSCLFSADTLGEFEPAVAEVFLTLKSQGGLTPEQAASALRLGEAAGKKSFQLEEDDAPREAWIKPFSEARILKALAIAFGAMPEEEDVVAVYELLKSQDHGSALETYLANEIDAASEKQG
jgi:hypothetical protein